VQSVPVESEFTPFDTVRKLSKSAAGRAYALAQGRTTAAAMEAAHEQARKDHKKWTHEHNPPKYVLKQFVAWDGEGITVDGVHRYVIFANSLGDSLVNANGLTTEECFELMLRTSAANPKAIHVIFSGSYDANMILKPTLLPHQAYRLGHNGTLTLKKNGLRYRVTYHPRHEFSISEEVWHEETLSSEVLRRITIWDIFGSFQASFVEACKARLSDDDLAELQHIEAMKGNRSTFTIDQIPQVLEYCRAELRALVKLAEVDAHDTEAAGIVGQSRWDGAGAKASVMLRNNKVRSHKVETPDHIIYPAKCAYAGGRIEPYRFGNYEGPLWTLDIRSAYPWAATMLPSLAGGVWHPWDGHTPTTDEFAMYHIRYIAQSLKDLHPFHWRAPDGNVGYPAVVEGWYWAPEVSAALAWGRGDVEIIEGWCFEPATDVRPFAFLSDMFHARKALERSSKGRGIPLKLAINSVYGKLAQQLGGTDGKPPAYHQLEWAGWITSRCRAAMFTLAVNNLRNLVSIETDGISFTGVPGPEILAREGGELGDYEIGRYDAGTWVQSGIYWLRQNGEWRAPKVRGVGKNPDGSDVLRREDFLAAWDRGEFLNGAVEVEVTRFRGMTISTTGKRQWKHWAEWVTETREIKVSPHGKREHLDADCVVCRGVRTLPFDGPPVEGVQLHETLPVGGGTFSAPHKLAWDNVKVGRSRPGWWLEETGEDDDDVI
jgi:hypothetical protein